MARRNRFWRIAAPIYTVVNVGGAIFAFAQGETMHAAAHGAALLVGFLIWQAFDINRPDKQAGAIPEKVDLHLDHLQESVDELALKVERMGENQRFVKKVLEQRADEPKT